MGCRRGTRGRVGEESMSVVEGKGLGKMERVDVWVLSLRRQLERRELSARKGERREEGCGVPFGAIEDGVVGDEDLSLAHGTRWASVSLDPMGQEAVREGRERRGEWQVGWMAYQYWRKLEAMSSSSLLSLTTEDSTALVLPARPGILGLLRTLGRAVGRGARIVVLFRWEGEVR